MAVIPESNRIPLEPAMAARLTPVECARRSSPPGPTILPSGVVSASSLAPPQVSNCFLTGKANSLSGPSLNEWMGEI